MTHCFDEGRLRAYLDNELLGLEQATVARHLSECTRCRSELSALHATAQQAETLLAPTTVPQAHLALAHFRATHPVPGATVSHQGGSVNRSRSFLSGPRRAIATTVAVFVVLLGLLAFPPVRAAADDLLQVFRVKSVVFVPISEERVRELRDLNIDGQALFTEKPTIEGDAPQSFDDQQAAATAAGFALEVPATLPSAPTANEYQVWGKQTGSFTVNVESARQLVELLDVKDVTIPDALGSEPIIVNTEPIAAASYTGEGYSLKLTQGRSPEVTLPDGVDLAQLGSAMLQVLGTESEQAKAMASSIDWSSTLVVPIPSDISSVQQVSVNGAQAMLVSGGDSSHPSVLYWQNRDRFYVLEATGLSQDDLIVAAESVR